MGAASDPAGDVPMPAYPRTRPVVAQPEAPASPERAGAAEPGRRVSAPEPADRTGAPEHGDRARAPEPADRTAAPEYGDRAGGPAPAWPAAAPVPTGPEPEEDELALAVRERGEYLALAQRVQADFENFRRRTVRDRGVADARAKAAVVREILPVADNLERALLSVDEADTLAGGVRLVLAELHAVLERTGIEPIEAEGEPFDPTVHEALTTRVAEGTPAGVVLDVAQKGYRLGDALIRPARVVVSA